VHRFVAFCTSDTPRYQLVFRDPDNIQLELFCWPAPA
jgi:hypothetical protein